MAKAKKPLNRKRSPDPADRQAFQAWLLDHPREWWMVIAARSALRTLPLLIEDDKHLPDAVLPVVRAVAIARFAAKYPKRIFAAVYPASVAASAVWEYRASAAGSAAASAAAVIGRPSHGDDGSLVRSAAAFAAASAASYAPTPAKHDVQLLSDQVLTVEQLAASPLWPHLPPPRIRGAWQELAQALRTSGDHWSVWIDWYDDALGDASYKMTEAEDAAFTDIPGELPWGEGAEAVNTEIARRLRALTLARLAEVASPQPSKTDKNQLHAGPNHPFDVPNAHDDLSTLPLRQRNLIKGMLRDLPKNAPEHVKGFLRSYDDELKSRGAQPILGLLQDDADIIAAAVAATRAEDEWLEAGMRKAFDRFAENHQQFVTHFPLDADREKLYADTLVNEAEATGKKFIEPFEKVAEAARAAHQAGTATDDFMMVIDKMTEFARVVSTQPPAASRDRQVAASPEIKVSSEDRIEPVTTKKRVILGSLGFFTGTLGVASSAVTLTTTPYANLPEALRSAIEMLSRLLH
jgi:hypothetical protein